MTVFTGSAIYQPVRVPPCFWHGKGDTALPQVTTPSLAYIPANLDHATPSSANPITVQSSPTGNFNQHISKTTVDRPETNKQHSK